MSIQNKVYEVLKLLRPYDIDLKKMRVGSPFDGGYIFADILTSDQAVLSYGLGGEISFDSVMAMMGHQCYMFDHTITELPAAHANFHFYREGVAAVTEPEKSFYTVQDHLERFAIAGDRLILKMDVEGAEWEVISNMPDAVLARFEQIAIEVHDFIRMKEPEFLDRVLVSLEKINKRFTLFHVHANNNNELAAVGGFPIYNLLELSYIKTDRVRRSPSRTLYPTDLDSPNEQDREDYILSMFPFWPEGLGQDAYDAHAAKMKAKNDVIAKEMRLHQEAEAHFRESRIDKAEACLRECLKALPVRGAVLITLVNVLNLKAIALYNAGRYGDAVAALREALAIVPDHPDLTRNLKASLSAEAASPQR